MFGWLFGGSKAADGVVDGIKKGIDALVFTDEEKSQANKTGMELFIKYQEATQPQNLARRLIALLIVGLFVCLVVSGVVCYKLDKQYSEFIFMVLVDVVVNPTMLIIGFYFLKRLNIGKS